MKGLENKMNKMIEQIKEINPKAICIYKIGAFCHVYNRDAQIISFLFDYKLKELGESHKECGFPIETANKVTAKLQNSELNYLIIDRRNNYDVDEKEDYKENNKYDKIYEKAKKYVNCKKRINNISQYLKDNLESENISKILAKVEDVIYEN